MDTTRPCRTVPLRLAAAEGGAGAAGFGWARGGHHPGVTLDAPSEEPDLPILLFVGKAQSGPSRRMESLVAWVKVNEKARLRVIEVDGDRRTDVVRRFGIREFPSLVLIDGQRVVARLEGKATGGQIDRLLRSHLPA
jgi:hypothetical protein